MGPKTLFHPWREQQPVGLNEAAFLRHCGSCSCLEDRKFAPMEAGAPPCLRWDVNVGCDSVRVQYVSAFPPPSVGSEECVVGGRSLPAPDGVRLPHKTMAGVVSTVCNTINGVYGFK